MPVYKNNTTEDQKFVVKNKTLFTVEPGQEVTSQYFTTNTNLTLITETPYYNKLAAYNKITGLSATPASLDIDPAADKIVVSQITGSVTVHCQDATNTPAILTDWTSENPVMPIDSDGHFNKLIFTGSGDCSVYQFKIK